MDTTGLLIALAVVLIIGLLVWMSYRQYKRKARIAQAKSRAALNQLLLEADRIERGEIPPDARPEGGPNTARTDD